MRTQRDEDRLFLGPRVPAAASGGVSGLFSELLLAGALSELCASPMSRTFDGAVDVLDLVISSIS